MEPGESQKVSEFCDLIKSRRSVRSFKNLPVDKKLLFDLLDIARWAPSHCNTQDVSFIIIDDDEIKNQIIDMGGSVIIRNAPVGVVVLYNNCSDNLEYSDFIQSGAAVIQNLLLLAHANGLGACWVAHLPRKSEMRTLLDIPPTYDPIAYVLLGYPARDPKPVPRKYDMQDITSFNKFRPRDPVPGDTRSVHARSMFRSFYYKLPTSLKKIINPIVDRIFVKKFEN